MGIIVSKNIIGSANQAFKDGRYIDALELYCKAGVEIPILQDSIRINIKHLAIKANVEIDNALLLDAFESNGYDNLSYMFFKHSGLSPEVLFSNDNSAVEQNSPIMCLSMTDNAESLSIYEIKKIAENEGVWDEIYYLNANEDVKNAGIDPFLHYIENGWKEGRRPSKSFDTSFYLEQLQGDYTTNPLAHYIMIGKDSGFRTSELYSHRYDCSDIVNHFRAEIEQFKTDTIIDILVPVYNGVEYLNPLFESVYRSTKSDFRLLVCNDCSPDENALPILNYWKSKNSNFLLFENEENLGFVGTINKLVGYTNNHFVILNTDTEVPSGWLERLMLPIFEMEDVATTTPFTNAGTVCSFPEYLEDNEIISNLTVDQVDKYFSNVSLRHTTIEMPTGVGFCMGVNKDVVKKIGMFNPIFGKGYGEENDFCQRAQKFGYKNIFVTNLFVYHKHGGSFSSEAKKQLVSRNLKILNDIHPNYDLDVSKLIREDKLLYVRAIIEFQIQSRDSRINLFFNHGLGGGAEHYLNELIVNKTKAGEFSVVIENRFDDESVFIKFVFLDKVEKISVESNRGCIELIFSLFEIDEIFINSVVGFEAVQSLIRDIVVHKTNQKIVVPIHDYYPLCPSFTLIDDKGKYCGVPKDLNECNNCLKRNDREFKKFTQTLNISAWRNKWFDLFEVADEILCFSKASLDIFLKAYPHFLNKISVVPHDISGRFSNLFDPSELVGKNKIKIGVLGGINESKGIYVLKELSEYINRVGLPIEIVIFGSTSINIESSIVKVTGRYEISELPSLIVNSGVNCFMIPSIWPETFSYTTDEVIQMGYPLAVFNLGAPAERVKNYAKGLILDSFSADYIVDSIYDFMRTIGLDCHRC